MGERIEVVTAVSAQGVTGDDAAAIVGCGGRDEVAHFWSDEGGHRVLRTPVLRRKRKSVAYEEAFEKFFPKIGLDGKTGANWTVR